ncbi:MAG TPA: cupin domain-containing protein [Solirubrobacteraceae bacterium]|nr:cupin domain-containing protein [Solirubrobacteraceae bacterium]
MKLIPPREGEVIGDSPDRRVEMLSDVDSLHATWSRFGPRRRGANLHIHYLHSDLFYVLAGELTVMLGPDGDETVAPVGTLVHIPRLVVHGFRNGGDAEVRYLNFHAPGEGFADYMRGLSDFDQDEPPDDGGGPVSEVTIGDGIDTEEIAVALREGSSEAGADTQVVSLYILEGELVVDDVRAVEGTWLQLPAGESHSIGGDARYLDVRTPS